MLIDSHCHFDYEPLSADLAGVLARAKSAGVDKVLSISTKLSQFDNLLKIAESNPMIYCSIGIHPHNASTEAMIEDDDFLQICEHSKVIAIGEAGLDYYYDYAPKDVQDQVFRKHIDFARKTQLPLIIHTRDADEDTEKILREETAKGAFPFLLHCFTGSEKLAWAGVELGGYVSFSGILTYKTAQNLRDIAKILPADRILVETDSPYLAPGPMRGKSNEPAFVVHTAQQLADVRNVTLAEIGRITSDNFHRLFKKVKK
ncbi:MAG: TatD family deoxyribonuclease [Alphaproteobacteria bacterium]|nr:MAG: TatD family deoxyribonuclease [Alphaproteobacteria bacterium]